MNSLGSTGQSGTIKRAMSPIADWLTGVQSRHAADMSGTLASYIPELTKADPSHFGIVLTSADGHSYAAGDVDALFTIQSVSKPLVYGLALEDRGTKTILEKIGVEPTGEAFNSIVMDEVNNRPFNPMVNAGAIATTALIKGNGYEERFQRILDMFSRYAGRKLTVDESVFESERATGHRNRAIAYLQLNSEMIEEPVLEHLDLYFRQCAILVSARDLSMMAATLANNGVNPKTGERAIASEHVKTVLSIMASCGMYDYSGEWVYRVGLPAKSGVGGGIMGVLPGQFGFGTFSPLLDEHGNSHRGMAAFNELSQRFHLHVYDMHFRADNVVRRSYRGGSVTSKRLRANRERQVLDSVGHQILAYELQGGLYFATAEQLVRRVLADGTRTKFVVLDVRRVSRVDRSALTLIRDLQHQLTEAGTTLVLAEMAPMMISEWEAIDGASSGVLAYPNVDAALEYCENRLIERADPDALDTETTLDLSEMDILRGFSPADLEALQPFLETAEYEGGATIIREGDLADRLYLLARGKASVDVSLDDGRQKTRLAAFRPGVAFGEFALFDGGRRAANVVAETGVICYVLNFQKLEQLGETNPGLYRRVLFALGRLLTDRLRRTTAEIRSLA
jgi:glutaminase